MRREEKEEEEELEVKKRFRSVKLDPPAPPAPPPPILLKGKLDGLSLYGTGGRGKKGEEELWHQS